MTQIPHVRLALGALALGLTQPALAQTVFTPTAPLFDGSVWISGEGEDEELLPGDRIEFGGYGFIPGQTVTLMRGTRALNAQPITVDGQGKFTFAMVLDKDAAPGAQPIVAVAENPAAAVLTELPVATPVALSGADAFVVESQPVAPGPYQIAVSPRSGALFVTSAVGHPPVRQSALSRIDPATLKTVAKATPAEAPKDAEAPGLYALYGAAVDDANGTVWVTNSMQDTVAVYRQDDLSLVRQFPANLVPHPRDVLIDAERGRAYVSPTGHGKVMVFDTRTLEQLPPVVIDSQKFAQGFGVMSLALDQATGKLLTVSLKTGELALVDPATGQQSVHPLPHVNWPSGVALDAAGKRAYVASQGTGNLLIVDTDSGKVLHDVAVGAGALNVAYDASTGLAWVVSRGTGTITAVAPDGRIAATLKLGGMPNHVAVDGKGTVYAVTKATEAAPDQGNRIFRITARN